MDDIMISFAQLRQQIVQHKSGQRMLPHYLPPEGKPGVGGPDADTELKGFHRDYDRVTGAVLTKYENGGMRQEIGRTFTQIASVQPANSYGPYLRATMLELRDVIAPRYLETIAGQRLPAPEPDAVVQQVKAGRAVDGAEVVLADLAGDLKQRPDARQDVAARLKRIGDDYQRQGDDYMAETADILAARAAALAATMRQEQLRAGVQALREREARMDFSATIDYDVPAPTREEGRAGGNGRRQAPLR